MLSQSNRWYPRVPKSPKANHCFRKALLSCAKKDTTIQRQLRVACEQDILFWINAYCLQFNSRKKGKEVAPFITWDFQDKAIYELLWCIEHDEDVLIEKSRQMGASWMIVLIFCWLFLYRRRQQFTMISRDIPAVDSPSPRSLFWKFDFIIEHLPRYLLPSEPVRRLKMFMENPEQKSTVDGEASTGKAAVGSTLTAMGIDEFSQIDNDYEVLGRTSDSTGCRIFNGTHLGEDTAFFELSRRPDMKKIVMHWSQHPDKNKGLYRFANGKIEVLDKQFVYPEGFQFVMEEKPTGGPYPGLRSPWYDKECERKGHDRLIAVDLDIDPTGSVDTFFPSLMINDLIRAHCEPPWWKGRLEFDKETGKPLELIQDKDGNISLWCQIDHQGRPAKAPYGAGCDISYGTGRTPSCLSIGNAVTGGKVCQVADSRIDPVEFAYLVNALCRLFLDDTGFPPLLVWEIQGPGQIFSTRMVERLNYPRGRIWLRTDDFVLNKEVYSERPGFNAGDHKACLLVMQEYRDALRKRQFLNPSKEALESCRPFRYDRRGFVEWGGAKGMEGEFGAKSNHGDLVVADALCLKMMKLLGQPTTTTKKEEPVIINPWGSLAYRVKHHEEQDRLREEEME